MPSKNEPRPTNYLNLMLIDGARPFAYRRGVRTLLGLSEEYEGGATNASRTFFAPFTYLNPPVREQPYSPADLRSAGSVLGAAHDPRPELMGQHANATKQSRTADPTPRVGAITIPLLAEPQRSRADATVPNAGAHQPVPAARPAPSVTTMSGDGATYEGTILSNAPSALTRSALLRTKQETDFVLKLPPSSGTVPIQKTIDVPQLKSSGAPAKVDLSHHEQVRRAKGTTVSTGKIWSKAFSHLEPTGAESVEMIQQQRAGKSGSTQTMDQGLPNSAPIIERLSLAVQQLAAHQVESKPKTSEAQSGEAPVPHQQQHQPVREKPVIVVKPVASKPSIPAAFWERRYMKMLHLKVLR